MEPQLQAQRFIGVDPAKSPDLFDHDVRQMFPIYDKNFKRWLPSSKSAAILDFGCGYGTFLNYLSGLGYQNLHGVDPDERCAGFCASKKVATIVNAADPLVYLAKTRETFDFISVQNVISYFERERVLVWFASLKQSLKQDGRLLIEVNNSVGLTGAVDYIQDPFMKSLYTDISLRGILEATGFEVEFIGPQRIPCTGFKRFLWLSAQRVWHGILKLIYVLERGASERNPRFFHSRLVVVARRP